eukprot:GHVR01160113.1.p1 GENE.GHVR01160113.1~~GHVR01160113.1.p1  ORF type:complete len:1315 (+),score=315.01 GHVR01160113.1:312-3947(+)
MLLRIIDSDRIGSEDNHLVTVLLRTLSQLFWNINIIINNFENNNVSDKLKNNLVIPFKNIIKKYKDVEAVRLLIYTSISSLFVSLYIPHIHKQAYGNANTVNTVHTDIITEIYKYFTGDGNNDEFRKIFNFFDVDSNNDYYKITDETKDLYTNISDDMYLFWNVNMNTLHDASELKYNTPDIVLKPFVNMSLNNIITSFWVYDNNGARVSLKKYNTLESLIYISMLLKDIINKHEDHKEIDITQLRQLLIRMNGAVMVYSIGYGFEGYTYVRTEIMKLILEHSSFESVYVESGWKGTKELPTHSMGIDIKQNSDKNTYRIRVINTGEGLLNHFMREDDIANISGGVKILPYIEFDGVPKELLLEKNTLNLIASLVEPNSSDYPNIRSSTVLYSSLLEPFHSYMVKELEQKQSDDVTDVDILEHNPYDSHVLEEEEEEPQYQYPIDLYVMHDVGGSMNSFFMWMFQYFMDKNSNDKNIYNEFMFKLNIHGFIHTVNVLAECIDENVKDNIMNYIEIKKNINIVWIKVLKEILKKLFINYNNGLIKANYEEWNIKVASMIQIIEKAHTQDIPISYTQIENNDITFSQVLFNNSNLPVGKINTMKPISHEYTQIVTKIDNIKIDQFNLYDEKNNPIEYLKYLFEYFEPLIDTKGYSINMLLLGILSLPVPQPCHNNVIAGECNCMWWTTIEDRGTAKASMELVTNILNIILRYRINNNDSNGTSSDLIIAYHFGFSIYWRILQKHDTLFYTEDNEITQPLMLKYYKIFNFENGQLYDKLLLVYDSYTHNIIKKIKNYYENDGKDIILRSNFSFVSKKTIRDGLLKFNTSFFKDIESTYMYRLSGYLLDHYKLEFEINDNLDGVCNVEDKDIHIKRIMIDLWMPNNRFIQNVYNIDRYKEIIERFKPFFSAFDLFVTLNEVGLNTYTKYSHNFQTDTSTKNTPIFWGYFGGDFKSAGKSSTNKLANLICLPHFTEDKFYEVSRIMLKYNGWINARGVVTDIEIKELDSPRNKTENKSIIKKEEEKEEIRLITYSNNITQLVHMFNNKQIDLSITLHQNHIDFILFSSMQSYHILKLLQQHHNSIDEFLTSLEYYIDNKLILLKYTNEIDNVATCIIYGYVIALRFSAYINVMHINENINIKQQRALVSGRDYTNFRYVHTHFSNKLITNITNIMDILKLNKSENQLNRDTLRMIYSALILTESFNIHTHTHTHTH